MLAAAVLVRTALKQSKPSLMLSPPETEPAKIAQSGFVCNQFVCHQHLSTLTSQAEMTCIKLEEEVLLLKGQLQSQDADMAQLHLKCQSAEHHAAEQASAHHAESIASQESKAMQINTRNLLLAQVTHFSS